MMLVRRRFLLSIAAACLPAFARNAMAQAYPTRPVRLLVGFPAGGPNDILGRLIAEWLSAKLGQPFVVENIPGSSGNIATEAVVRAAPDGYTLLLCGPANAISASLPDKLDFVFLRDIAPVGGITREALVMVVHPSVPAASAKEFIAYAASQRLKMASTGNGSSPHVTGELFKQMSGLDLEVVHYAGGGPALKAMIGGEAQMMFEPMSAAITPVKAGSLRALAVTSAERSPALDVPTVADTLAGFEASVAAGIGAPKDTPAEIIAALNTAINAAFADPTMAARLADTGGVPLPGSPSDFGRLMAAETEKWGKVVKAALAKPN